MSVLVPVEVEVREVVRGHVAEEVQHLTRGHNQLAVVRRLVWRGTGKWVYHSDRQRERERELEHFILQGL